MKMIYWLLGTALLGFATLVFGQQCGRHSCHGDVGNLVAGRFIAASSTCGGNKSEVFCDSDSATCSSPSCRRCRSGRMGHEHPSSHLTDSPFFRPNTWWQSANGVDDVTLSFNLETTFYFTHLIMLFRSPRPGAMTLERSLNFGRTWEVYQRFARNCSETFRMEDDVNMEGASCTSRYSQPTPCHRGEVIYRAIDPINPIDDPYSVHARHLLKITNIRIRMWKPQLCPSCDETSSRSFTRFSIYDIIVRGTCFCNGHADTCVPLHDDDTEPRDQEQAVVHGKCICEHNTEGDHCESCMPLYNDAPWLPGNGDTGVANPCKRCRCHGHAHRCSFDMATWYASGNHSGGVCGECQHNTTGRHCQLCKVGFFRRFNSELSDQDACQECLCNRVGTINMTNASMECDIVTGQCLCKAGVGGRRCDRCLKGYWGFGIDGCNECLCEHCEQKSGICLPDYGDDISFIDVSNEGKSPPGYDLTRHVDDDYFVSYERSRNYPVESRFPDDVHDMLAVYPVKPVIISRSHVDDGDDWGVAASRRPSATCRCEAKELENEVYFCKMKYDYAVKVHVRGAMDQGSHATLSVSIRKIIKQNKVDIRRGKMKMFPESWTIMGCTCPVLMPGQDYLVIGHEDVINNKLMINVESIVKNWWIRGKNWTRSVKKLFRKKCV